MESPDKDALKGMLLDRWMDDLRHDRSPSVLPELRQLDQHDIAETLALARWLTAMPPTMPTPAAVDSVVAAVRARIRDDEARQHQALGEAVEQATSFGGLLLAARGVRQLKSSDLERSLKLPSGTLANLEGASVPPHRIPLNTMLRLLRALRIATGDVVNLIRQAGVEWASRVYTQPVTQLGRIDSQLDAQSRYRLLAEATAQQNQQEQLAEELERLEVYCQSLISQMH